VEGSGCSRLSNIACPRDFAATNGIISGLFKEIRLNINDRPITVRRWNMSIPISRFHFSTAKRNPCL
jgi:hypothetical protein